MSTWDEIDLAIAALSAGRAPEPNAGRAIAEAARCYFGTPAGEAMRRRQATQERDRLLLDLAARHFNALPSVRAKARAVLTSGRRYEATGWLRERHAIACPPHRIGKPEGHIWAALKACPDLPSDTLLRDLLANTAP